MEKQTKMKEEIIKDIIRNPVIPVFYHDDVNTCIQILKSCYEGGIRVFEFVNRGNEAEQNFKALRNYKEEHFPDLRLGIGTIMHADDADRFIELGADFLVSPIFSECVASSANRSEEHTSELQSRENLVCRLLLEKKKQQRYKSNN